MFWQWFNFTINNRPLPPVAVPFLCAMFFRPTIFLTLSYHAKNTNSMKFEQNIRTNDRQSSKGNQLKWENEGIWYKADYTGYEGLVEYMIFHLLKKSSLAENEFVCYDLEEIKYGTVIYNGVKSPDFLAKVGRLLL